MFQFTVHEYSLFTPDNNDHYLVDRLIFIFKSPTIKEAYKKLLEILNQRVKLSIRESGFDDETVYLGKHIFKIIDCTGMILFQESDLNKEYIEIHAGYFRKKKDGHQYDIFFEKEVTISMLVQSVLNES